MIKWNILRPVDAYINGRLGKFCCHLVYFSRFGMFYKEKSVNPGGEREKCLTGLEKMENRYFDKNV
jgi:hypothetical protein